MRKSLVVAPLPILFAFFVACANKPNPVPPSVIVDGGLSPFNDAGPIDGAAPMASGDAGPAAPTGPTFFTGGGTDAGATPTGPVASSSTRPTTPPGPPALGDAALDGVIDVAIAAMSPKVAPKMDKEGQPGRATLKEGEHFGMVVTLQPGRCYSFVGFSPPMQVTQLDLHLYAMPLNVEAGHSTSSDKAAPVMGKGTAAICPILPVAVPYKLDVVASKGAGRMGVYIYSRSK